MSDNINGTVKGYMLKLVYPFAEKYSCTLRYSMVETDDKTKMLINDSYEGESEFIINFSRELTSNVFALVEYQSNEEDEITGGTQKINNDVVCIELVAEF